MHFLLHFLKSPLNLQKGIEKILSTMMPTEEEKNKITEAQNANPDIPLGNAESFLLMLSSITALEARLKLWAFRLDYGMFNYIDYNNGCKNLLKN